MRPAASLVPFSPAAFARGARAELEDALGPVVARWPWRPQLSRLMDAYILLEERAA